MIPAYQFIDLALGRHKLAIEPPVAGWAVCEAGYYDRPQCFPEGMAVALADSPDEATELYCYAVAHSKYPGSVHVRKCWVHTEAHRHYWTPR